MTRTEESHIRLLTNIAERNGWPTTQAGSLTHDYTNDLERFQSWAVETLLWAYQRDNIVDKLLAVFQAIEYAARAGRLPHPAMFDMITELKQEIATHLRMHQ